MFEEPDSKWVVISRAEAMKSLRHLVQTMIPLTEVFASDESSPEDRRQLRRVVGEEAMVELRSKLIQLTEEHLRRLYRSSADDPADEGDVTDWPSRRSINFD